MGYYLSDLVVANVYQKSNSGSLAFNTASTRLSEVQTANFTDEKDRFVTTSAGNIAYYQITRGEDGNVSGFTPIIDYDVDQGSSEYFIAYKDTFLNRHLAKLTQW